MGVNLSTMASDIQGSLLSWPHTSTRRMFGSGAFFVGSRMFAFIWRNTVVTKLPQADQEAVFARAGARPGSRRLTSTFRSPLPSADARQERGTRERLQSTADAPTGSAQAGKSFRRHCANLLTTPLTKRPATLMM